MPRVVNGKTLLTYDDYALIPEDGKRHELIGGVHYVSHSPRTKHQRILTGILPQLYSQIQGSGQGEVFIAPLDTVFSDFDVVQPDLLVILKENSRIITEKNIQGAPDLVVEITSPSTEDRDLDLKKTLYQTFGVREYWVVLTEEDTVEKFLLEGGAYKSCGRFQEAIEFSGIPGVVVDLTKVFGSSNDSGRER